jgi:hypothetical protein
VAVASLLFRNRLAVRVLFPKSLQFKIPFPAGLVVYSRECTKTRLKGEKTNRARTTIKTNPFQQSHTEMVDRTERRVYSFCCLRANKLAMLIHATSHIPLTERQTIRVTERMYMAAKEAVSDADVTARVNDVQDNYISEVQFRTPGMWKFCRSSATLLAYRLSLESNQRKGRLQLDIAWRLRKRHALSIAMFKAVRGAADDNDVNARIGNVYNAALIEHGIPPEV